MGALRGNVRLLVDGQEIGRAKNAVTAAGVTRCRDAILDPTKAIGLPVELHNGNPGTNTRIAEITAGNNPLPAPTGGSPSAAWQFEVASLPSQLIPATPWTFYDPAGSGTAIFTVNPITLGVPSTGLPSGRRLVVQWYLSVDTDVQQDELPGQGVAGYNRDVGRAEVAGRIRGDRVASTAGQVQFWRGPGAGAPLDPPPGQAERWSANDATLVLSADPNSASRIISDSWTYPAVTGSGNQLVVWAVYTIGAGHALGVYKSAIETRPSTTPIASWGFGLS